VEGWEHEVRWITDNEPDTLIHRFQFSLQGPISGHDNLTGMKNP